MMPASLHRVLAMFSVFVQLRPSPLSRRPDGLGVFLTHAVAAGAPIWSEALGWDVVVPVNEVATLPLAFRDFLALHGHRRTWSGRDCWYLPVDEARHLNESALPNLQESSDNPGVWCSTTDLAAGAELFWKP
jgi:hypothetical protein